MLCRTGEPSTCGCTPRSWPQVEQTLRDCNVTNYTIFVIEDTLFAYYEYVGTDHAARHGAHRRGSGDAQEWWTHTDPARPPSDVKRHPVNVRVPWTRSGTCRDRMTRPPTRALGSTGLRRLTEIGFGAASIGNLHRATTDDEAMAAVTQAWVDGIRYFDTAPHYGLGLSERRLGEALGYPRDEYVVSTKVGRLLEPNPEPTPLDDDGFVVPGDLRRVWDFTRDGVRRSLDESLRRLRLDDVDVVYAMTRTSSGRARHGKSASLAELRAEGVTVPSVSGPHH